ncbi:cell division protein FtsL [Streptomyces sp. NPDC091272]|uniref:FtsB family cell division protein n=1 Tax=Streptomyces sp. NPDC091272 TaxID=3365981 RepID=UPI00380E10B0
MPSGPPQAARAPFVLLVVVLLGGGLICLLMLNSALNEGSFRLNDLKKQTTELTDEQQALQRDVDDRSAPGALERRARELGMVPGGPPAFLGPDGKVRGEPSEAPPPEQAAEPVTPQRAPVVPSSPVNSQAPSASRAPSSTHSAPTPPAAAGTSSPVRQTPTTSGR